MVGCFERFSRRSKSRVQEKPVVERPVVQDKPAAQEKPVAEEKPVEKNTEAQKDNKDSYVLRRDYTGSSRLNLQYYLWKSSLGFTLHPSIPKPTENARIADIATGTAIWLLDISDSVPSSAQLDGFDISLSQCPPTPWLPSNVKLATWDMFEEPPEHLVGQYDIVHVRLIMLVLKGGDPVPVIKNLRKLLKPTGYLQWDEVSRDDSYVDKAYQDREVDTTAIEALFRPKKDAKASAGSGPMDKWQYRLTVDLNATGFKDSTLHRYPVQPALSRYFHDMYMTAFDEFTAQAPPHQKEQLSRLTDQAVGEAQEGGAVVFPMLVWVAKAA